MSSPTSTPWKWDFNTRSWVYEARPGVWVDKDRNRVAQPRLATAAQSAREPSEERSVVSPRATQPSSRWEYASPVPAPSLRRDSDAHRDATLAAQLQRVQIQPVATPAVAALRSLTTEDPKTGDVTRWVFGPTKHYVDPKTSETRPITQKFVRKRSERDGGKEDRGKGDGRKGDGAKGNERDGHQSKSNAKADKAPEVLKKGKAVGKIIERNIVSPGSQTGISAASAMMSNYFGGERVRVQRYAVVQEGPDNRDVYRAVLIKTYNGEGVSNQIKCHHAQVYSTPRPLPILRDEWPDVVNERRERPMQTPPIRVETYDLMNRLDPISRLDYADSTDFEYGDPEIRLYGYVHEDSVHNLITQWQNVKGMVEAGTGGAPRPDDDHQGGGHRGGGRGTGRPSGSSRPAGSSGAPPALRDSGRGTSGSFGRSRPTGPSGAPPPLRDNSRGTSGPSRSSRQAVPFAAPPALPQSAAPAQASVSQERVPIADVTLAIRRYRDYADENDLNWRVTISQAALERMANDRQLRESTIGRIRDNLNSQMEARNAREESSDDDRNDDGTEDEDDEDDDE